MPERWPSRHSGTSAVPYELAAGPLQRWRLTLSKRTWLLTFSFILPFDHFCTHQQEQRWHLVQDGCNCHCRAAVQQGRHANQHAGAPSSCPCCSQWQPLPWPPLTPVPWEPATAGQCNCSRCCSGCLTLGTRLHARQSLVRRAQHLRTMLGNLPRPFALQLQEAGLHASAAASLQSRVFRAQAC